MKKQRIITKEAREQVKAKIRDSGSASKSEIVKMLRPYCRFDPIRLQEQALNRVAGNLVRSMKDEEGTRTMFLIPGKDRAVNVETRRSLSEIMEVERKLNITRTPHSGRYA